MTTTFKKALAACLCAVVALCLVVLPGCGGKSEEQQIREALSAELDQLKTRSGDEYDEAISELEPELAELEEFGISAEDLIDKVFADFDYKIDSVEVDGDSAKVGASITSRDFSDFSDRFTTAIEDFVADAGNQNLSEEEVSAKMGELILQVMDESETSTVEMTGTGAKSSDGTWDFENFYEEIGAQVVNFK